MLSDGACRLAVAPVIAFDLLDGVHGFLRATECKHPLAGGVVGAKAGILNDNRFAELVPVPDPDLRQRARVARAPARSSRAQVPEPNHQSKTRALCWTSAFVPWVVE
jgi:hypothetical protein